MSGLSANGRVVPLDPHLTGQRVRSKIVIGIRDLGFHQEVFDWVARDPRVDVAGAAEDVDHLLQLLGHEGIDVAVLCPSMARHLSYPSTRPMLPRTLVVAQDMTVPVLREAIDLGAHGVFAWPDERDELSSELARLNGVRRPAPTHPALVTAVIGSRGGAGTTFLASHLAASFAAGGTRCVLVDLESGFGDLTIALGLRPDDRPRTIADLLSVIDELSPDHVADALHEHRSGFAVLLAPLSEGGQQAIPARLHAAVIALLAADFQSVVLHLPRGDSDVVRRAVELADEVLLLITLDLLSLYGARRTISALRLAESRTGVRLVANRVARAEVTSRDVERVLGMPVWEAIQADRAVPRTQDRGELLAPRSRRAARDVRRLCRKLAVAHASRLQERS